MTPFQAILDRLENQAAGYSAAVRREREQDGPEEVAYNRAVVNLLDYGLVICTKIIITSSDLQIADRLRALHLARELQENYPKDKPIVEAADRIIAAHDHKKT